MKRRILVIVSISVFVIGAGVLAFPFISIFFNNISMEKATDAFDNSIVNIIDGEDHTQINTDNEGYLIDDSGKRTTDYPVYTKPDLDRLLKDMQKYNENLKTNQRNLLKDESCYANPCFNLSDYGIYNNCIGYVSAPSIDMEIPVYLGANDANMEYGAAHLTYTSMPLGGKGTNAVLAAHTGYIGRVFFDNIPNLNEGDSVYIQNFWSKLEYRVVAKKIIESDDIGDLFIENDKDLLTLITCHRKAAGVYNRWLVVCERA